MQQSALIFFQMVYRHLEHIFKINMKAIITGVKRQALIILSGIDDSNADVRLN
jgi:F420-0:gamma-glutamyl ligase